LLKRELLERVAGRTYLKVSEAGESLNQLKLQKLAYYSEAWSWAMKGHALTGAPFQAWIHGPVSRELFDRFKDTKSLYSLVGKNDIRTDFNPESLDAVERGHIDCILDVYAPFTGSQLETMTHNEDPWTEARKGYSPTERCEVAINPETMRKYYGARLT
jgi:uncharacterized phage-associated protein